MQIKDTDQRYRNQMRMFWSIFYWSTFTFAYLIVPFMTQYEDSGEIEVKKRIIEATIQVISRYAIYAVLGIFFLGILWLKGTF